MIDAILARDPVDDEVAKAARRAAWASSRGIWIVARASGCASSMRSAPRAWPESDLAGSTGYGYDDSARARYESILARFFRGERALARLTFASGTRAIVTTLAACTAPGDTILTLPRRPYDTLHHALVEAPYSLASQGIACDESGLEGLPQRLRSLRPKVVFIQRSRGYAPRPSPLSVGEIEELIAIVRTESPESLTIVDNCYGEFVEEREPLKAGADAIAGFLIKNVGGGLAPTGGYVIGRAGVVERVAARHCAPGLRDALGPTLGFGRALLQGLFTGPVVVGECLRGLDFAAALFGELGYEVDPLPLGPRTDIVQAITLGDREALLRFARGLQSVLPVNARFTPEPGPVPGYVDPVVMSSGSFIAGATIELSCDAPLRSPYQVYLQGGTMAEHVALGVIAAARAVKGHKPPQR